MLPPSASPPPPLDLLELPPRKGRRVAVVGARSFLGRNVLALLEAERKLELLLAIDDEPSRSADAQAPTSGPELRTLSADLTAPGVELQLARELDEAGIDTVLHLAFLETPSHAAAFGHELESVGTMRLLRALRRTQVTKLVLASQTWLYGAQPGNANYLTEDAPLRAARTESSFADKIAAEREVAAFASSHPEFTVTVLRMAPLLGPTADNVLTRWLGRRLVPTRLGFDPLVQVLHEVDAIGALKWAVFRNVPGVYNVVADGVMPLSTMVRMAGGTPMPLPHALLRRTSALLWMAQLSNAPPGYLEYLRYLCVADGDKARAAGHTPAFSSREAVLDFVSAQRLRDVHLLRSERA